MWSKKCSQRASADSDDTSAIVTPPKKTAAMWNVVWLLKEGKRQETHLCKLCEKAVIHVDGTTNQKNHLFIWHRPEYNKLYNQTELKTQPLLTDFMRAFAATHTEKGAGFKHLLSYLEPGYRVHSHTHIATVCCRLYNVQERLKKENTGCGHLPLTTDIWTSSAVDSYLTVTVHFIDKLWQMYTHVLLTTEMPERHTGVNIVDRLTKMAKEWDVPYRRISAIVHDNAANAVLGAELTD